MKLKKIDTSKDELMARVRAEINLPRLTESVRLGLSVQMPYAGGGAGSRDVGR